MPDTTDFQTEQFMALLTDALRAGPASPEWSQAVKVLRAADQNVDEYTLLCTAREDLESGKDYRSVRAGVGFTRKVMEGVEKQGTPRSPSTAGVIVAVAGVVIVGVIVTVTVLLLRNSHVTPDRKPGENLAAMIFGNRLTAASFVAKTGEPAAASGWVKFGDLPLTVVNSELRPIAQPTPGGNDAYKAGGWVTSEAISAEQAIEVNATIKLTAPGDDGFVQVFVSEEPITPATAVGARALVWQLKGTESRVFLPDGRNASSGEKLGGLREITVRIRANRDSAVIDAGDKRVFSGPHLLSPGNGRYVGVRFLRRGGENWDYLAVSSLAVQKP